MGLIIPMVHTLNKTNCVHKTLVKTLILMLMLINYIYLQRYVTIGFYSTFQQKLPAVVVPGRISGNPSRNYYSGQFLLKCRIETNCNIPLKIYIVYEHQ